MKQCAGLLLALLCVAGAAPAQHPLADLVGSTIDARVTRVADGDTLDVVPAGERRAIRVRVFGIDAPERGEPFSAQARNRARVLVFDKQVRVTGVSVDRYGRLVARVRVGEIDLGLDLLSNGLACHFRRYSDDPLQAKAEAAARSRALGFWASGAQRPRCASAAPGTTAAPAAPAQTRVAAGFIGNTSSRVFHAPGCRNAGCKNCTRKFASEQEAIAAGFRPAGDCLRRR
jgi:micrococcal nuclease